MRYPASLGIILLGLAVGISGEHSQRPHNGGFVVRHRDTRGHKRRVHEQNVSSSTSSHGHTMERSDRGHALIEGNLRHTDSATAAEELQSGPSEARQSRRAAAVREQDRDNIFVDRTKPTVVAAPGENVTIKCVTPWIDMVNAWKKNDVVLESGQPGVEMTSVRLPSDQLKGFIDKMVGMEAEEEKLLARKAELAESARVNKASLGDGISGVGEGAGSRTRPANRGKTGGDDPKQAGKIGEDSGEDVESKSIESDDQEAADADEDEPEQNNKDVERGVVDQSGVAHRHRQGRTHRSATRSKQQTPKGPSDRLKAMFSQGQKLELWTLRLHNVSTSDEGNYTCGGEAVTYFHLRVEEPEEEFPTTSESTEPAGKAQA